MDKYSLELCFLATLSDILYHILVISDWFNICEQSFLLPKGNLLASKEIIKIYEDKILNILSTVYNKFMAIRAVVQ